ncbi:hypothetical protein B0H11DRAFT_78151 [Mycena galericulata]|nr:hypothetical protein B0H11DRAFT_78151 [Mycena galericulata]
MDANFLSLLPGEEPTELQTQEIRALLRAGKTELTEIDNGILEASLSLAALYSRKCERIKSLAVLSAIVAPIRRVPCEILGEIFLFCRGNSLKRRGREYCITDARDAPIVLTHVSSHWRAVCLSTPRLWDYVAFKADPESETRSPNRSFIRTILDRSHELPLALKWDMSDDGSDSPPPILEDAGPNLRNLWDSQHRLKQLHLILNARSILPAADLDDISLPLLAFLDIRANHHPDLPAFVTTFRNAPSLRSLSLQTYYASPTNPLPSDFPWFQLTFLKICVSIDHLAIHAILTQCTQLNHCVLSGLLESVKDGRQVPVCTIQALHSLSLGDGGESAFAEFFQLFALPNLTTLRLSSTERPGNALVDLQKRSPFKLQELDLKEVEIPLNDLVQILEILPTLQKLAISQNYDSDWIDNDIFEMFSCRTGTPSFTLPQLTSLTLNTVDTDLDGCLLADMVESLQHHAGQPGTPFPDICSVTLRVYGSEFSADAEKRLAHAKSTGFLKYRHFDI